MKMIPKHFNRSVVQADFTNQDQPIGTLAILGPTRMEYGRIIGMLSHMKHIWNLW